MPRETLGQVIPASTHESSFDIRTPRDFLRKMVVPQYGEFVRENSSSRHALLAFIVAFHMYEWVNGPFEKATFSQVYPDDSDLAEVFDVARRIANGTKHFKPRAKTMVQAGFSSGFSDGFARPLNVILPDGTEQSADRLLRQMIEFWQRHERLGTF